MFNLALEKVPSALGDHQSVILGSAVFSPSAPTAGANFLLVQAITQNIRYTLTTGADPTAATGFELVASAAPVLIPLGGRVVPRFFREAAGAVLQYQWLE